MMIHSTLSALSLNITDGKHGDCENSPTSGYYFISCKDVRDGTIHYEDARQITERDFLDAHKRTLLEPNDILITNSGTIGRMAFVTDTLQTSKTTFQKSVAIVKPNPNKIIPKYLYYVLLNSIDSFITQANGSAQKNLLLSTMRSFNLFIDDDKQVQARIASILSAYDNLIENNQKQIKLLEEAAQRLYKEWFIDLRFPGWENTKIVDGVPEGWEKLPLSSFADIVMGQSPKSEFYNTTHDGIPFHQGVGSYGKRFVVDNIFSNSYARIAEAGSILFSVRAPVGRLNITKNKIAIGRGLAALNHKKGYQSFLFYLLKDRFFKDDLLGNGSIFASISKNELYNQVFIVPNNFLANQYNIIVSKIDRKISIIDEQLNRLVKTRDGLLSKLMNAEMEV